jgi:arylsulfatase A-like enzyme
MPAKLHHTHWVGDRSIDFLKRRNRENPFFLWSSFIKPHPPFDNPPPWNKLYRTYEMEPPFRPEGYEHLLTFWNRYQNRYKYMEDNQSDTFFRTMRAAYYACLSFIDSQIGRILEQLGDEIDNTLILFSSDHGELLGDYGSVGKRSMLEPAARVPLIARYPKKFQAGDLCSKPVSLLDLYPTFLKTADCKEYKVSEEGDDLSDIATEKTDRQYTFSQFSSGKTGLYLITDDRFKYSYCAADKKECFIDLKSDPQETKNVATDKKVAADKARLKNTLISRFEKSQYTSAIQNGEWKDYGICRLPLDKSPNYGLLQQDMPNTQELVDQLGPYARNITMPDEGSYKEAQEIINSKNHA